MRDSEIKTLFFMKGAFQLSIRAFVKGLDCKVEISCNEETAEAKSVIKLMKLGAKRGSVLEVRAEGKDAAKALQLLKEYRKHHL